MGPNRPGRGAGHHAGASFGSTGEELLPSFLGLTVLLICETLQHQPAVRSGECSRLRARPEGHFGSLTCVSGVLFSWASGGDGKGWLQAAGAPFRRGRWGRMAVKTTEPAELRPSGPLCS